ncbi:STAS domain-containing protein [Magnetococcales bacterium HHB-1]
MDLSLNEGEKSAILALSGDVTIQYVTDLKKIIVDNYSKVDHLKLDMANVSRIDLAGLQLLCAANRTFLRDNKTFSITGNVPEAVSQSIQETGYGDCLGDNDTSGLWRG